MFKNKISSIIISLIIFLFIILLQACVQNVSNVELPYKELLVVSSFISPQDDTIRIKVEKTLPPLSEYNKDLALINDAEVFIECNGEITLLKNNNSQNPHINYYCSNLKIIPGNTYNLTVKWKNLKVTASTKVPVLDGDSIYNTSVKIDPYINNNTIIYYDLIKKLTLYTNNKSIYFFRYFKEDPYNQHLNFYKFYILNNKDHIDLQSNFIVKSKEDEHSKQYISYLIKFDYQFRKFYDSKNNGELDEDPFSTSGINIQSNIKGDGIGYFYAYNCFDIDFKLAKLIQSNNRYLFVTS